MRSSKRPPVGFALIVASLVLGCSSGPGIGGPSASQPPAAVASQELSSRSAPPSRSPGPGDVVYKGRIDVGNGRRLDVRCVGVGTPTVLLEGGGIDPTLDEFPDEFVKDLGSTTTTCHYSRAGGGASDPLPGTQTMAGFVDDADALLAALQEEAGVQGPYVFAGWSFGGGIALAEALAHPDDTAGLVLLDTDFIVEFMPVCLASGRSQEDCQKEYDEDIEAKALETELVREMHPLPNVPMRIVSAMQLPFCDPSVPETLRASIGGTDVTAEDCAGLAARIAEMQLEGWSTIGPQAQQTLVEADHDGLLYQQGEQIADVIRDVVLKARPGS